ncbi:MAG: peptidyl-prolyl cis-trans isomerase [Kiritimatiellae bacterium]|nr:peptidyl-prolyl cis-trans isomerase [Kiritimatiellia bacterium]
MKGLIALFCFAVAAYGEVSPTNAVATSATPKEQKKMQQIVIETSKGKIVAELDAEKAPATVANFLSYVDDKFYDGTIFHRVIDGFMIQGGGFTPEMRQKATKPPVKNEADNGLANARGTLAMARTMVVDSATCQFFINLVDNGFLNFRAKTPREYGYCVFGKVTEGMEVVDAIAKVATGNKGMHQNVPEDPVTILSIRRAPAAK